MLTLPTCCRAGHARFRRWLALLTALLAAPAPAQNSHAPGFYRIIGREPGMSIYLDEDTVNTAGQHPPGIYTLRVEREGFFAHVKPVRIISDHVLEINIRSAGSRPRTRPYRQREIVRLHPVPATLVATSDPPGQTVWLDSLEKGTTPVVLENITSGRHVIRIGEVSDTLSLRVFESRRVRAENGRIIDVSAEDLPAEQQRLRLVNLSLFMESEETKARNCRNFDTGRGATFFRLEESGSFLICRLAFENPTDDPVTLPVRFRLYQDSRLIHEVEHDLPIRPGDGNRVCYFHHEWWRTGEYILTVDGIPGNRLGQVRFTVIRP
ncbi:MAG: PEGA domain-containing protein [candidate division KSB1 bacterium]|nr:PEGA domain-containing protein [candidate division KSB1 bacterium]MDZ7274819.1 PEGA domain-containing protein [candidate division KSB1 bacterium]MDZ7285644.1 PEGA domain-containing protein [candidate division KSB1 bacterium]MDZ7298676.1 PEGA domain-containing protein [candidate division KSB1 bacterium]MDZ7349541.1 PEGA domain-containing protein [candidate division KSB1 bacterium]